MVWCPIEWDCDGNVIFDILEPPGSQKHNKCLVFFVQNNFACKVSRISMRLITTVKERCILYLPVIRQFGGGNRNLQIYFGNNLVQIFDFHQNCILGKCVSPGSGANVTFVLLGCSSPRSVSHPICEFFANVCTSMLTIVFFHQGKTGSMKAAPRRWRGKQLKHAETPDDHPSH